MLARPPKRDILFLSKGLMVEPTALGISLLQFGLTSNAGVLVTNEALTIGAFAPAKKVSAWIDAFPADLVWREGIRARFVRFSVNSISGIAIAGSDGLILTLEDGRRVPLLHPGIMGNTAFSLLATIWQRSRGKPTFND